MWHHNRVPKKAFFYWGTEQLPWIRYLALETFRKFHPDWEILLYVKPVNDPVVFSDPSDNCWSKLAGIGVQVVEVDIEKELNVTLPAKYITVYSDLFRYWALDKFGGFYTDLDMLFFRSLEDSPVNRPEFSGHDVFMLIPPFHHFMWGIAGATWWKKVQIKQIELLPDTPRDFLVTTAAPQRVDRNTGDRIYIMRQETCEENFNANGPINEHAIALNWHGSGVYKKYAAITEQNYMESDHPLAACVRYCLTGNMGKPSGIGSFEWIKRGS